MLIENCNNYVHELMQLQAMSEINWFKKFLNAKAKV